MFLVLGPVSPSAPRGVNLISAQSLRGEHGEEALELVLVRAAVREDVLGSLACLQIEQ